MKTKASSLNRRGELQEHTAPGQQIRGLRLVRAVLAGDPDPQHGHTRMLQLQGLEWRDHHVHVRSRTELPSRSHVLRNTRIQTRKGMLTFKVIISKVELHGVTDRSNGAQCTIYPLPPCTFLGLRPSYVTGIGALTYVTGIGAMFIFRAIHRAYLHILNFPPSTDT